MVLTVTGFSGTNLSCCRASATSRPRTALRVAVAHEGTNTLAMLVRRKVETLAQLLTRLDLAIAQAQTEDVFTDEVNPGGLSLALTSDIPSLSDDQFQAICGG